MTTYYVRKTGSDAAAGTSAAAAWLTIGKALGAAGIASGDTVYIGAGTYREVVTVAMTSATVETSVIGDVDGVQTGDVGEVVWTAYLTNDTTAPSASALLTLSGRDFLTFRKLTLIGGTANIVLATSATSTNIKFADCALQSNGTTVSVNTTVGFSVVANWTFERCLVWSPRANAFNFTLTTGVGSDYDANIVVRNCRIDATIGTCLFVQSSGTSAQEGGGITVHNSTLLGNTGVDVSGTRIGGATFPNPVRVYDNIIITPNAGVKAGELGALVENYNYIAASTTHTNVTPGANTITNSTYAQRFTLGNEAVLGTQLRPHLEPTIASPFLGFGNDATYTSSEDLRGYPRPAGGATATKGIGAYERSNTFARETGTVRTGLNAISITGPGYQDFQLPVNNASTTVTVYVRWDATYAGTKPRMQVLNGSEAGVNDATATATGASDAWEQLSLTFTPTAKGIVTIRLLSSDTNGAGKMFADDFNVA